MIRHLTYWKRFIPVELWKIKNFRKRRIYWDVEVIKDLMSFFDLTFEETIALLRAARIAQNLVWKHLSPKKDGEIINFYETMPLNPFVLAYWHMQNQQRQFRKEVIETAFGKVLDFGGGIGDLSIELARKGLDVTYGDVQGVNMKFAMWRFENRGLNIRVIDLIREQEKLERYDTVLCIDVIEHVPEPKETLQIIAQCLGTNGKLVINQLSVGPTRDHPQHLKLAFDAKKFFNSLGIEQTNKKWLWIKSK